MSTDARRYREDFERHGASGTHSQVIAWVSDGARVLELGCASGQVGRVLVGQKHCSVTGVEIDSAAAGEARDAGLTVHQGSLCDADFRAQIQGTYDFVIAADVLEHLADPDPVLEHVKRWLAPGGFAIIAVPNIASWNVRFRLFFGGHFEYEETGVMDRTHVHFFTYDTFHALLAKQGWTVKATMIEGWEVPGLLAIFGRWPLAYRKRIEANGFGRGIGSLVRRAVYWTAGAALDIGDVLAMPFVKLVPNLCAPHVAVLVAPPASDPATAASASR
jgi:methionine biosynthesis protein MetW